MKRFENSRFGKSSGKSLTDLCASTFKCYGCGSPGHKKSNCPSSEGGYSSGNSSASAPPQDLATAIRGERTEHGLRYASVPEGPEVTVKLVVFVLMEDGTLQVVMHDRHEQITLPGEKILAKDLYLSRLQVLLNTELGTTLVGSTFRQMGGFKYGDRGNVVLIGTTIQSNELPRVTGDKENILVPVEELIRVGVEASKNTRADIKCIPAGGITYNISAKIACWMLVADENIPVLTEIALPPKITKEAYPTLFNPLTLGPIIRSRLGLHELLN